MTSKDCSGQLGNSCPQVPIVQRVVLSFKSSPGANGWKQGTSLKVVLPRSEAPALAASPGTLPPFSPKTQLCRLQAPGREQEVTQGEDTSSVERH